MAMGEAIALGIAKGIGTGYQQHFADQRRERMEMRRMDKSFDMFKKQTQYTNALGNINKQNEVLGQWEEVSKLDVKDIAFRGATKMSLDFAPKYRPKFVRESMKNLDKMDKASMLSHFGYNKPDYSQWINDPEYQDAIPMSRIAGMRDGEAMDQVFKYDPRVMAEEQKVQAEKVTDYMRKKQDEFKGIQSMAQLSQGARPSDEVTNLIWKSRPEGMNVAMKGSEAISYDQNMLTSLITNGQVVKVGSQLKFKSELSNKEMTQLGIDPAEITGQSQPLPLYTEPESADYIAEQEQIKSDAAMDSAVKSMSKELGTGKGTPMTTYNELAEARDMIDSMSPDALDYLFKVGFSTDTVRDVAAKFGDENAQMAKNLISKMSGTVNSIRHDLFGSALTEGESAAFQKQFADIGLLNSKENLTEQLENLMSKSQSGVAEKLAGYTPEQRQAFLERNPIYKGVMNLVDTSVTEDVPAETKQTVSDSSTEESTGTPKGGYSKAGIMSAVDGLIASGKYDESQRAAITSYMMKKAGL